MSEPSAPGVRELIDAIVAIGSDLELEALLRRIVESVTALVGARYGALGVLDESRTRLAQFITTGIDAETRAAIGHLPDGHGILGLLIVDPRPLRLADLSGHPGAGGFPPHHPPMTSFLGVPIRLRDRVFGNLYLTDKMTAAEFSALDEELAVGLAGAAAVAIEHARLYTQVQDLTLTADRDRIARDLHDTVIQRLFATGLALQATSRLVRADPDAARDRIERAVDELDGTVRQIRTAIFGLGSASPTVGAGLRERVLTVASDAARPLGFHPAVTFEGVIDANVDDTLAREALAALREALTNVARHARAGRCAIVVRVHDQQLTLEVMDDGVGPGRRDGAGRGLRNLAARAEQRHGRFELVPGPGGGTAARWTVPLAPRAR